MQDWLGLGGKNVLVVGAGGFGARLARAYLDAGASVRLVDVDGAKLEKLANELSSSSLRTSEYDVSRKAVCDQAVEEIIAADGTVDVFVHAAGVNDRSPIDDMTEPRWVVGVSLAILAAVDPLADRGRRDRRAVADVEAPEHLQ